MNISAWTRFIALFALLTSAVPVKAQLYSAQSVGDLGGGETYTSAINGFGKVTGRSSIPGDVEFHAFLWNGTTMLDLGTLGGTQSYGAAINAAGNVTGFSNMPGDTKQHAFLWNGTSMKDLGTLGGSNSEGTGINASGEVTGWSQTAGNVAKHAFLWNGTTMKDLGTLGGTNSAGVAINDSAQVAGSSDVSGNTFSHAFLWNGASMKDLGVVGSATTVVPFAMNNAGQVVGYTHNASYSIETGFLWDGTKMLALKVPGATYTYGSAINAKGQVTGAAELSTDKRGQAYLWKGAKAFRLVVNTTSDGEFTKCSAGTSISSSTGLIVGETCEEGGLDFPWFWNGFAMIDLANLVVPPDFDLDLGFAAPLINNQGQILDGPYVLTPIPGAIGLNIAQPYTFAGCQNVAGFVSSSTPAPPGGLVISLSDNLAAASVPSTVTIPAGAIGATFTISTMPVTTVQNGSVTATHGGRTVSQAVSIRPIGVSAITVTPNPVKGGNPVTGNVTLECNAAPASITVALSSNNSAVANPVASTITIPKGQSSKTFQVTTKHVMARVKVVITASANGVSKSANLNVNR
jgi:probable HAF family extracellular repeat protein